MTKYWKIKNISKINVPVAVGTSSCRSKGVLLEPGQFCIGNAQMTASLDAQTRRRFVVIEHEFDNSLLKLELGQAYNESIFYTEAQNVANYTSK